MARVVGILQPGYLPWVGFFEQMLKSDVFVIYDDVQYDKHGWRNRNRVKGPNGPVWLTVPVRTTGLNWPRNNEVEIDPTQASWAKKHLGTLRQCYAKAPYWAEYYPALQEVLYRPRHLLLELDMELIGLLAEWLGIRCKIVMSSSMDCPSQNPTARLVKILGKLEAEVFYEGASGRNYLDMSQFHAAGIRVEFQDYHPAPYPQQFGGFLPYMSVLDLLFNCGPDSRFYLPGLES